MSGQMPVMDPKILSVFPGLFLGGSRAALGVGLLCCRLPGRHRSEVPGSHLRLLDCIGGCGEFFLRACPQDGLPYAVVGLGSLNAR